MSSPEKQPALTVVIPTPDGVSSVATTLAHLRRQTIHDQLEVIVCIPEGEEDNQFPEGSTNFLSARVLPIPAPFTSGRARARGVRAAASEYVVFGEDHCFPAPQWAEAIVRAHEAGANSVAPKLYNGSRGTIALADHLVGTMAWIPIVERGPIHDLPGRNSSHRRDMLLALGDDLEELMEVDSNLHARLRRDGAKFMMEPDAVGFHHNYVRLHLTMALNFHLGRNFAAGRGPAAGWSTARRIFYGFASPLIPLVRFSRILPLYPHAGSASVGQFIAALPPALMILIASGAGEMLGYFFGAGDSRIKVSHTEFKHFEGVDSPPEAPAESA